MAKPQIGRISDIHSLAHLKRVYKSRKAWKTLNKGNAGAVFSAELHCSATARCPFRQSCGSAVRCPFHALRSFKRTIYKNEVKQHVTEYQKTRIEKKVTGKKMQSSKIATLLYSDIFSLRYSGTACAIGYS